MHASRRRVVKKRLPGRAISTVQEMGWAGVRNGELLAAAETQFDVFITADKNLRYQQNLKGRKQAIVLLPTNQVPLVEALIPAVEATLSNIRAGDFVEVPLPSE